MKQNRWVSLIEVTMNVGSGFLLAWLATLVVIPIVIPSVKNVDIKEGLWITITFTVISLVRSYAWRRFFNNRH
jgi:membrane protein implicated in regulation of membrane protease activity